MAVLKLSRHQWKALTNMDYALQCGSHQLEIRSRLILRCQFRQVRRALDHTDCLVEGVNDLWKSDIP